MNKSWPIRPDIVGTGLFSFRNRDDVFIGNMRLDAAVRNACVHHLVKEVLTGTSEPSHVLGHCRATLGEFLLHLVDLSVESVQAEEHRAEGDVLVITGVAAVRPSIASDAFALDRSAAIAFGILAADRDVRLLRGLTRLELPDTLQVAGNSGLLTGKVGAHVEDARGLAVGALTAVWEVGRIAGERHRIPHGSLQCRLLRVAAFRVLVKPQVAA